MPQGFNINNFNSFIEQARDKLLCDTNCQNKKTADQLKQDYLNAQTNLATAPFQVEETEKKYVTFTQGELAYNDLQAENINQKGETIAATFKNTFDTEVEKIKTQIQSYSGIMINYKNIVELYIKYKKENIELFKELKDETSDLLTNERKTYYEDQGVDNLNFIYYYILLTIYVIFVLGFGLASLMYTSPYNWKIRLSIFILFIVLPFVASYILDFFIGLIYFIYELLPKNVRLTI